MLRRLVTYTDFDGESHTEEFYFNLSKAELIELEMSTEEGYDKTMKRIIAADNRTALIREFKKLILDSYGVKSADGKGFKKSAELRDEFEHTEAFSELFVELCTQADAASAFFTGLVPASLAAEVQEATSTELKVVEEPKKTFEDYTQVELQNMSQAEFQALVPSDPNKMTRPMLLAAMQRKVNRVDGTDSA
jgi:hypothetical protein